jgi:P-type Cu2+ transporter
MSGNLLTPACCPSPAMADVALEAQSSQLTPAADPAAFVRRRADGLKRLDLMAENIHCAACIQKIEKALRGFAGVSEARVNLSLRRIAIAWRGEDIDPRQFIAVLAGLGYPSTPYDPALLDESTKAADRELLRCLAVAGFAAANVMLLSISVWSGNASDMDSPTRDLFHWVSALIALPAVVYSGRPFFMSAWSALRGGGMNMDVPISLGVLLASATSLFETMQGARHVYFDASVTLLFFLLCGRYLDRQARARARSAAEHLLALTAVAATVLDDDGGRRSVAAAELRQGMLVVVAAGERIPADGTIESGVSDLDNSLLTGESLPAAADPGNKVLAGALNLSHPLRVRVTSAGENTFLASIAGLMAAAEQGRARYVRLADRIARLYAPVIHIIAAATFVGWLLLSQAGLHGAMMAAVAVLIITCPCALALAVPVVQVVASGLLLRRGVLIKKADALERLAAVDTIVFDKTGTLTEGRPRLLDAAAIPDRILRLAAALARYSRHPLAMALAESVKGPVPVLAEVSEVHGRGLAARAPCGLVRLGSRRFCGPLGQAETDDGLMEMWFSMPGEAPCRLAFTDCLRADAKPVIERLRRHGYRVVLLSGDRPSVVAPLAGLLGINDWRAGCLPADKVEALNALASAGRKVLMVGDGLNDAPALAAGFASMSPASAAAVSQTAADLLFQGRLLAPVALALGLARGADRLVRQNFALAIFYNFAAVPLAIAGLVTPLLAAIAMSSSSLLVTVNALRLKWVRP